MEKMLVTNIFSPVFVSPDHYFPLNGMVNIPNLIFEEHDLRKTMITPAVGGGGYCFGTVHPFVHTNFHPAMYVA